MAAGIDDVAPVAYGMKDVAALETMWDVPYTLQMDAFEDMTLGVRSQQTMSAHVLLFCLFIVRTCCC